jgi:hypothetical protein
MSILARYPGYDEHSRLSDYVKGDMTFTHADVVMLPRAPSEILERRLALAGDLRSDISPEVVTALLARAKDQRLPLLEAQTRRAAGLANRDPRDLSAAIVTWERAGALSNLGRARAERGLLIGDQAETDAGLAILKRLGDVNYVDRFAARV